jgi:hypothetical protein
MTLSGLRLPLNRTSTWSALLGAQRGAGDSFWLMLVKSGAGLVGHRMRRHSRRRWSPASDQSLVERGSAVFLDVALVNAGQT